jgi:hypothetical protein
MNRRPLSRREVCRQGLAATLAAVVLGGAAKPAAAAERGAWFKYDADLERSWEVAATPGDPLQREIRRKGARPGVRPSRVLVLYPRASSAYDIAITRIVRVFEEKELDVAFTVV